jgi:hypothetical protein
MVFRREALLTICGVVEHQPPAQIERFAYAAKPERYNSQGSFKTLQFQRNTVETN